MSHIAYQQIIYPVTGITISVTGKQAYNRNTGITWDNNTCKMHGDPYDKNSEMTVICKHVVCDDMYDDKHNMKCGSPCMVISVYQWNIHV